MESESITEDDNDIHELRTYSRLYTNSSSSDCDENSRNCTSFEITGSSYSEVDSCNNFNTHAALNTHSDFFLIEIHSMQGWTATTRHGVR